MDIFLQVLGIFFLAVVLFIALALWAVKRKIRQFGETLKGFAVPATPNIVTLNPAHDRTWSDRNEVRELAQKLESEGFSRAAIYRIDELPDVIVWAMVHPGEGAYAAAYEHPTAGHWYDIFVPLPDGGSLTFTTAPMGHELDQRPGHQKFFQKGAPPSEFMSRLKTEFRNMARVPVSAQAFEEVFERAYRETMEWRNSRGGPTIEEIRRVAENMEEEFSEDTIRQTHAVMAGQATEYLDEKLRKAFLKQSNMSAAEWDDLQDRIYIVHDQMGAEEVWQDVEDLTGEDPPEPLEGESPRKYMARVNDLLPPAKRFQRISSLAEPIVADVYAEPAEDRAGALD